MNRWVMEAGALLLIAVVAAGWHYRARIMAAINPPASAANPMEQPDVLYTWVDKEGVTHYSQAAGKGARVEYDGSGITPVAPVEASFTEPLTAAADGRKGSATLHDMRREMQENQMRMQETKDAAAGL
ncbi:MAG: DUF4124 domain-containing protein [Moraxellaceae bacterium]